MNFILCGLRAAALRKGTVQMSKYKLSHGELSAFCTQVALMLGAGLPLYDGMEALAKAAQNGPEREIFTRVSNAVNETGCLSEALRGDGAWPAYLVEMIAIGERAGCLEKVMNALSVHYEREAHMSSAIRSAVTYPVVLCVMMLAIILIMILKVLPIFRRVLGGMGVAMNAYGEYMTRAGAIIGWIMLGLTLAALALTLLCVLLLRTSAREKTLRCINRCLPPLRRLNRRVSAARTASLLSMLLSGGFPMGEALEMLPGVLSDRAAAAEVEGLRNRMMEGDGFADALAKGKLFEPLHCRMICMGAAVGREDQVMETVARSYEEAVEEGVSRLVSVIEPTLVAFLCVVIGMILLSVMLPMIGVISSMI